MVMIMRKITEQPKRVTRVNGINLVSSLKLKLMIINYYFEFWCLEGVILRVIFDPKKFASIVQLIKVRNL